MAFNEKQGTGYASFRNTVVPSAGKTGTAEVFQDGEPRVNSTYIGYAPSIILNYLFNCLYKSTCSTTLVKWWRLGRDVINYYFKDKIIKMTLDLITRERRLI